MTGQFLSTPSARRATMPRGTTPAPPTNFYPRPPRGGRHRQHLPWRTDQDFYPRPPRGGRPHSTHTLVFVHKFLSTPSARRATSVSSVSETFNSNFYPRPPRGGRLFASTLFPEGVVFLSTPSARRATCTRQMVDSELVEFLSTPSARRATLSVLDTSVTATVFLSTPSARRATHESCRVRRP